MPLQELVPVLQIAIGPVILISGVGLLLLTMTNRYGRIIDRTRQLSREVRTAQGLGQVSLLAQLKILLVRAQIVRAALAFAATSVLLAAALVMALFLSALLQAASALLIVALFSACLIALMLSLFLFIRDINLSLRALRLEIGPLAAAED